MASSFIEGVTAPVVDVVLAEADESGTPSAAAWVAANLAAVTEAVDGAHSGPLTVETLCGWHRTLMTGSPTPAQHVGVLGSEQAWIGGTSPLDAHLVTPPPDEVRALVDDPAIAHAHAQFEIIHPFADGNGRVGRVLVAWILVRRLSLVTPPPVSARITADVGGYGSGLVLFRSGDHNSWIRWFAAAVSGAGRTQQELVACRPSACGASGVSDSADLAPGRTRCGPEPGSAVQRLFFRSGRRRRSARRLFGTVAWSAVVCRGRCDRVSGG